MAFRRLSGKTKLMYFKKDTTDLIKDGSLVTFNLDSGQIVRVGNDSDDKIVGVARQAAALADSGYYPVEVPVELAVEWEIDLDSDGGAADSDIGKLVNVDTTGGNSVLTGDSAGTRVDISDSAQGSILVTRRIGTTKIVGVIAGNLAFVQQMDT